MLNRLSHPGALRVYLNKSTVLRNCCFSSQNDERVCVCVCVCVCVPGHNEKYTLLIPWIWNIAKNVCKIVIKTTGPLLRREGNIDGPPAIQVVTERDLIEKNVIGRDMNLNLEVSQQPHCTPPSLWVSGQWCPRLGLQVPLFVSGCAPSSSSPLC